jgi:glucokinase
MKKYAIGADIGGSHISSAAIDLTNATVVRASIHRTPVNAQGDAESILSAWTGAMSASIRVVGKDAIKGVGLAMPGPFDYPNGISLINDASQNKFLSLYRMNIKHALSQRLELDAADIRFKNDAECFLLGEVFGGAGKGAKRAIGVTLGTGFGSAFVLDGKSEDGNLWCAPFRGGIAEDSISTRWFLARYKELTGQVPASVKELACAALDGEVKAKQAFEEFGSTLSEFLVPLTVKYKADTLVIGGNIALSWDLFIAPLQKAITQASPSTRLVQARLGEEAALMGGASLLE